MRDHHSEADLIKKVAAGELSPNQARAKLGLFTKADWEAAASPGERAAYAVLAEAGLPGAIFPYSHAIDEAFHLIPRRELPAASVVDRDGVPHISVEGAEAGTWKAAGNHAQARKWALEYLAAAQAMEAWQAGQAAEKLRERRDELAREFTLRGYADAHQSTRRAIDRIIELESK